MSQFVDVKQNRNVCIVCVCNSSNEMPKTELPFSRTLPFVNCAGVQQGPMNVAVGRTHRNSFRSHLCTNDLLEYQNSNLDLKTHSLPQKTSENKEKRNLKHYTPKNIANFELNSGIDRLKNDNLLEKNVRKHTRSHYSESEKEDCVNKAEILDPARRHIRIRSESESTSIQHLQYWPASDQRVDYNTKSIRAEKDILEKSQTQSCIVKKVRDTTNSRKKETSIRILVYNNSPRANSPAQLKKIMSHRAVPVLGSPRLNRVTRNKTKLCLPKVAPDLARTLILKTNKSHRKAKSMASPKKLLAHDNNQNSSAEYKIYSNNSWDSESSLGGNDLEEEGGREKEEDDSFFCTELAYNSHGYVERKLFRPDVKCSLLKGQQTERFVASLFPNVPPYLSFCSHVDKRTPMPPFLNKILKWKLTTVMPKLIRRILINSGFRLLKKTNDWMGTWGKHMKSPCFKTVRSYQKFNHIPGSFKIGRKDSCWRNLQTQMLKHGSKEFGFMPKTYIMPQDLKLLRRAWPKYTQRNCKWIVKPPASARGTGIKVINRWSQIPKRKAVIVQRYIEKPFLINGSKFDLRLYVLVTSINPLRVYIYRDGLVRFASVKYSEKPDTLNDRYMHLTNYSINKLSSTYSQNEDVNACKGHKWSINSLWTYLQGRGIETSKLWSALCNLVLRTLLAGEHSMNAMFKMNVESKYNCFELFGFDVILDSELVPWLLEVNISPSLHSELPLDLHVKGPLVQAVLNTALYHVPPKLSAEHEKQVLCQEGLTGPLCNNKRMYITYLSREEKFKHNYYTKKSVDDRTEYLHSILENLTPDDLRCLIVSEDELQRSAPLERIFPVFTTHKYLKYTEMPRYYNLLLDAWEQKYHQNRHEGIHILRELCKQNLHLEVPTQPVRKGSSVGDSTIDINEVSEECSNANNTKKQKTRKINFSSPSVKSSSLSNQTESTEYNAMRVAANLKYKICKTVASLKTSVDQLQAPCIERGADSEAGS